MALPKGNQEADPKPLALMGPLQEEPGGGAGLMNGEDF